ncbi:MAG: HAD-IA family hydrolase [Gallionellaceae bacterium]|jgi:phosphoglycolate phosphatase|nr:HAD-IA family hydrolase [Gallionellaceae bacterium]
MTITTVLFDLDGTLADTAPDLALALNMQRERHGLPPLPQEIIRPHASHGSRGLLGIGFSLTPEDATFPAMRDEYLGLYDQVFTHAPQLFPGMDEVLNALQNAGVQWGVVTNKPARFTIRLMQALNLADAAACIVSGDDAERAKPYPDTLLLACEQARCRPESCLYVGDAERDILAGRAAGMQTMVACWGYLGEDDAPESWQADFMIAAPHQLLRILGLSEPSSAV